MGLSILIADPPAIDLYELNVAERSALQSEGALLLSPWFDGDQPAADELSVATSDGEIVVPFAMRDHVRELMENPEASSDFDVVYGFDVLMMTEQQARRLGFDVVEHGAIVRNGSDLTRQQRDALERTFAGDAPLADWYRDAEAAAVSWWPLIEYGEQPPPAASVVQGVAVGGVLVLTLLVVAIGLSLAATESRDERERARRHRRSPADDAITRRDEGGRDDADGDRPGDPRRADPDEGDHRGAGHPVSGAVAGDRRVDPGGATDRRRGGVGGEQRRPAPPPRADVQLLLRVSGTPFHREIGADLHRIRCGNGTLGRQRCSRR